MVFNKVDVTLIVHGLITSKLDCHGAYKVSMIIQQIQMVQDVISHKLLMIIYVFTSVNHLAQKCGLNSFNR